MHGKVEVIGLEKRITGPYTMRITGPYTLRITGPYTLRITGPYTMRATRPYSMRVGDRHIDSMNLWLCLVRHRSSGLGFGID